MRALLVLGAAVWADGPSPTLRRRALTAARAFHDGAAGTIIACGGLGRHPPTEAEAIRTLLIGAGVPDTAIRLEPRSTNTAQNIGCALPILQQMGLSDVLIVTDWFHAPRARMVARRAGLRAASLSPPLRGARPLAQLRGALREVPAYLAYALHLRG